MNASRPHLATVTSPSDHLPSGPDGPQAEPRPLGSKGAPPADRTLRSSVRALMDPLSVVVGFSELLLDGEADAEEQQRYLRSIHEAARQLEQQVRRLEALTRTSNDHEEQLQLF